MKTIVYSHSTENIQKVAALLHQSHVVGFPTETVYGLGAIWDDTQAVQNIYRLKKRPNDKSLSVHICDINQIEELSFNVPSVFYLIAEHFWPGPLTIIVPKKSTVPSFVSGNEKIALRFPHHKEALALIKAVGKPIIGTSANISGNKPSIAAEEVLQEFEGQIPAILDGGISLYRHSSTIIDLVDNKVLRWGGITAKELQPFLPRNFLL